LVQIVGYNRQPISVDEGEIAAIQTLVASGVPNQPCSFVEIGDPVRIESGPLRGLQGILVESRGHHKFVLSVTLLQRSVAVEIDALSVTPCRRDSLSVLSEVADAVAV
jgi:transcription antitermination factor NusG